MPTTCIAYIRVSTDEQSLGLQAQRAAIHKYAKAKGYKIASEHCDNGVSGAVGFDKRLGLLDAINALERDSVLLVAKRDRLSREHTFAAWLTYEARRRGARVESATEPNGMSPQEKLLAGVVDLFAEFERDMIAARTKAALAVKKSTGGRVGRWPTYGYKLVRDRRLEDGSWRMKQVRCEREQEAIRIMRQLDATHSHAAIAEELANRGYYARKGRNRPIPRSTIRKILHRHSDGA